MSTAAQHITSQMKLIFSEYGWLETIISNNGPCYSAEAFTKLMRDYSVNLITSSPHYLQSICLVEKYVQIVKNLFYRAQEGVDLYKKLNDLQKHPTIKPITITYVDCTVTNFQITTPYVQCSQKTTWTGSRTTKIAK